MQGRNLLILMLIIGFIPILCWSAETDTNQIQETGPYESIMIAPNPYTPGEKDLVLEVEINPDNYRKCLINIFNMSGDWIREIKDTDLTTRENNEGKTILSGKWNGKNHKDSVVSSGVYFVNFTIADNEVGKVDKLRKIVVIR